jgi:hypothetical protein
MKRSADGWYYYKIKIKPNKLVRTLGNKVKFVTAKSGIVYKCKLKASRYLRDPRVQ